MQQGNIIRSYYAIIPANVRYDKDLTANAKLLYGEITALCQQMGYCWATNAYFADLYNVSNETVSRWISSLEKKGYIRKEIIYKQGTKEVKERKIYIPEPVFPLHQRTKEETEEEEKPKEPPKEENLIVKEFARLYTENIGTINGLTMDYISQLVKEGFDVRLFKRALEIATDNGSRNLGYVKGIIRNWYNVNIKTIEELKAYQLQEENKKKQKQQKELKENDNTTRRNDKKDNGNTETNGDGVFRGEFELTEEERRICEEAKGMFDGIEDYI